MTIFVGSTNPVKINAATIASSEQWPEVKVVGFDVPSNISPQPMSDEETKLGSLNRAKGAMEKGLINQDKNQIDVSENGLILAMGLEGGVFVNQAGEMWSTVWATVVDTQGNEISVNGARLKVPPPIAHLILSGVEMGHAVAQVVGESDRNRIKQNMGMIGIITNNFVDRTEEYAGLAKLVLGLWFGRNWQQQLAKK